MLSITPLFAAIKYRVSAFLVFAARTVPNSRLDLFFYRFTFLRKPWKVAKVVVRFARWTAYRIRGVSASKPPIFIVGCGHSGTSLLLAILDMHPSIWAVPYESNLAERPGALAKEVHLFDWGTVSAGKHRWVEKTPKHIHHIDEILATCPEARIIWMVRDGRDVAASLKHRSGSATEGIKRWIADNNAIEPFSSHKQIMQIRYEDLITDFESQLQDILSFVGEPTHPAMKDFHTRPKLWDVRDVKKPLSRSGKDHAAFRVWQINQPLFDGRNRRKDLSPDELTTVTELGQDLLQKFGYL